MRRNLTISFDEGFIDEMDTGRDKLSRGKWLESLVQPESEPEPQPLARDRQGRIKTPDYAQVGEFHPGTADFLRATQKR